MDLRETEWETLDWIHVAQDKHQWWTLMNTVPERLWGPHNLLSNIYQGSFPGSKATGA